MYQEPVHELAFATSPGAAAAMSARSQMQHQQLRARRTIEHRIGPRWGEATGGLSGTQDFLAKAAQGIHQDQGFPLPHPPFPTHANIICEFTRLSAALPRFSPLASSRRVARRYVYPLGPRRRRHICHPGLSDG